MNSLIKIIDSQSQEELFSCPANESDKAYAYAKQLEDLGIDFEFIKPGTPETLVNELDVSLDQKQEYRESLDQEIHDHDDSCCWE